MKQWSVVNGTTEVVAVERKTPFFTRDDFIKWFVVLHLIFQNVLRGNTKENHFLGAWDSRTKQNFSRKRSRRFHQAGSSVLVFDFVRTARKWRESKSNGRREKGKERTGRSGGESRICSPSSTPAEDTAQSRERATRTREGSQRTDGVPATARERPDTTAAERMQFDVSSVNVSVVT